MNCVILLTEILSGYGDKGSPLRAGHRPDDGLSRIILATDDDLSAYAMNPGRSQSWPPGELTPAYPQLVWLAAAACIPAEATIWCVGEILRNEAAALVEFFGSSVAIVDVDERYSLVAYSLDTTRVTADMPCPVIHNDAGIRLFVCRADDVPLARSLRTLQQSLQNAEPHALSVWSSLRRQCSLRAGIRELCLDAHLCVIPDGEHGQDAGFHFLNRDISAVCAMIMGCMERHGICCEISTYDIGFNS